MLFRFNRATANTTKKKAINYTRTSQNETMKQKGKTFSLVEVFSSYILLKENIKISNWIFRFNLSLFWEKDTSEFFFNFW